jgi:hypothetical protein
MSIECSVCFSTLKYPDTVWYACTRFSFRTSYICEPCLSKIPHDHRHTSNENQPFKFTFGPLQAETSQHSGRLQANGSKQLPPQFWVETKLLIQLFDEKQPFFTQMYPYYDFNYYLKDVVKWHHEGRYLDEEALADELRWFIIFGAAIESYLNLMDGNSAEPLREVLSPYDVPKPATDPGQLRLARELMKEVIRRF